MKLLKTSIVNFRSIKDMTIDFDVPCRILVGINESGKSNILKALSAINDDFKPNRIANMRDALPDEDTAVTNSSVRFIFQFDHQDSQELYERVMKKILFANDENIKIYNGKNELDLKDFCYSRNQGLYHVDILKETKSFLYWIIPNSYSMEGGWKKIANNCPKDFSTIIGNKEVFLQEYKLINEKNCTLIPNDFVTVANIIDLSNLIGGIIIDLIKERKPRCIFWQYNESNLLPNSIGIKTFSDNPDTCVPLKNMFHLAGIGDIKKSINESKNGSVNQFQNFLDRIAKKTTLHFRSIWQEYDNLEFSLKINGEFIIPGIKEHNTHDFNRRSDGFKRFVTFLLMISVNVETKNIKNTLLLVDEPEISLHPSGARYLRNELIKISDNNNVVYSTHSIFMIDPSDISRHYLVKKNIETTTIESAINSNIADEEVLYNALGYSVFSILNIKNIIFEGWYDKRLFQIALENSNSATKKKFSNVSICHAKGVKSIKAITPLIELAQRNCVIISDGDKPAKEQQKMFNTESGYGKWYTYQEIDSTIEAITGEDFLKPGFVIEQINMVLSESNFPNMTLKDLSKSNRIAAILKFLTDNGMQQIPAKETLSLIKGRIFENISSEHIEHSYNKLLKGISFD